MLHPFTPTSLHALTLLHVAAVAIGLLLYVALTHSGRQRRTPAAAMAWVLALVAFPYLALPVYLLLGTRKLAHARIATDPARPASPRQHTWASALTRGLDLPPARPCTAIALHTDGQAALDGLLALLERASTCIDIEMFILRDDPVGQRVATALARASARGVRVRILLDGLGAWAGHRRSLRMLRDAGAQVRWFSPLRLRLRPQFGRGNLRNHRKLVVVDGCRFWSGGRNLAREYFLDAAGGAAWRDLSFEIEGGPVVDAVACFTRDWAAAAGEPARSHAPTHAPTHADGAPADGPLAQLLPSGPDRRDDTAYDLLLSAIHRADRNIRMATPYFVPDDALQLALVLAARRGVDVQLLVPARSNHPMADIARARSLRELAGAGVQVLLLPAMLHAKYVAVDDALATCGSINLDARSLFLNYELNTVFHDPAQIAALAAWHATQRAQCSVYVARAPGWWRDVLEGLVRSLGYQL